VIDEVWPISQLYWLLDCARPTGKANIASHRDEGGLRAWGRERTEERFRVHRLFAAATLQGPQANLIPEWGVKIFSMAGTRGAWCVGEQANGSPQSPVL
jgi:hypothetical protein